LSRKGEENGRAFAAFTTHIVLVSVSVGRRRDIELSTLLTSASAGIIDMHHNTHFWFYSCLLLTGFWL
jgi:hypothetical protein